MRRSTRGKVNGAAEGVRALSRRRSSSSRRRADTADVERAAKATGGWQEVVGAYKRRSTADDSGDASLAITLRLKLGRVLVDEVQQIDEALAAYRAVYEPTARTPTRSPRSSASIARPARYAELLGIYEKRRELSTRSDEKTQIRSEIAKLYETELKDNDKAINTYNGGPRGRADGPRRCERSTSSTVSSNAGSPTSTPPHDASSSMSNEAELIDLKFRLGQHAREAHRRRAGRAQELPRDPVPRCAARRCAQGPRGAPPTRGPSWGSGGDPREHLRRARRLAEAPRCARHPRAGGRR